MTSTSEMRPVVAVVVILCLVMQGPRFATSGRGRGGSGGGGGGVVVVVQQQDKEYSINLFLWSIIMAAAPLCFKVTTYAP